MARGSRPGIVKMFSKSSRQAQGLTRFLIPFVPGAFSPEREAESTSIEYRGRENVDLYIHSPIRLHDVVLNHLSTRKTFPFLP
jgi:hypothetical protein